MAKFEIARGKQKQIIVSRPPRANVADMLENVYSILGNQLRILKNRGSVDELTPKDAAKLHKMVQTLDILSVQEARHTAEYALDTYSDAELAALTDKITNDSDDL